MATRHKVSVSNDPTKHRLTSNERRAARLAEISNKQGDLKREAAERRAKAAKQAGAKGNSSTASGPRRAASARRSNSR